MEGSNAKTMDGTTRVARAAGPSAHTHTGSRCESASRGERTETLRARLITATVEVVAGASAPRLVKTQRTRISA